MANGINFELVPKKGFYIVIKKHTDKNAPSNTGRVALYVDGKIVVEIKQQDRVDQYCQARRGKYELSISTYGPITVVVHHDSTFIVKKFFTRKQVGVHKIEGLGVSDRSFWTYAALQTVWIAMLIFVFVACAVLTGAVFTAIANYEPVTSVPTHKNWNHIRYRDMGTSLKIGEYLSPLEMLSNGEYRLKLTQDCSLVVTGNGRANDYVYQNRQSFKWCTLAMQVDKNLVLYIDNRPVWSSGTDASTDIRELVLSTHGGLFFVDSESNPIMKLTHETTTEHMYRELPHTGYSRKH